MNMSPNDEEQPRILLIANNEIAAQPVTAALAAEGCHVIFSEGPTEFATGIEPDLVIVDCVSGSGRSEHTIGEQIMRITGQPSEMRRAPVLALMPLSSKAQPSWADGGLFWPNDASALPYRVRRLLARSGNLAFVLKRFDETAQRLARDEMCEWVRCRLGVFGVISIPKSEQLAIIREDVDTRVIHAYGIIDRLSADLLQFDDMWNLVLFIAVPWTKEEGSAEVTLSDMLLAYERDTRGSRKIVLWREISPEDFLHPFDKARVPGEHLARDPLGDALRGAALDEEEFEALQVLYKGRVSQSDLSRLILVLGRRRAT